MKFVPSFGLNCNSKLMHREETNMYRGTQKDSKKNERNLQNINNKTTQHLRVQFRQYTNCGRISVWDRGHL